MYNLKSTMIPIINKKKLVDVENDFLFNFSMDIVYHIASNNLELLKISEKIRKQIKHN